MLAAFICCCFAIDASVWSRTAFADAVSKNDAETLVISNVDLTNANMMFLEGDEIYHILNQHSEIKRLVFINVSTDDPHYFFQRLEFVETVVLISFRSQVNYTIYDSFLFSNCRRLSKVELIDCPEFNPETDDSFYFNVPFLYAYWPSEDSFDEDDLIPSESEPINTDDEGDFVLPELVDNEPPNSFLFTRSLLMRILLSVEYSMVYSLLISVLIYELIRNMFHGVFNNAYVSFQ